MKLLKFISPFFLLFFAFSFLSCDNNNANSESNQANQLSIDSLELEKSKIELEKEKIQLEKAKITEQKNQIETNSQNEQAIQLAQKAQSFNTNPSAIVVSEKANFYSAPDYMTKKKSYLVKGDLIEALRVSNNFIYIEFYSQYLDKTSKGWIDVNDIEHYNY
jgi:LAS superfamily LD-carboxypeptidase LdcB